MIEPIWSIEDLEQRVQQFGFLPMFGCGIRDILFMRQLLSSGLMTRELSQLLGLSGKRRKRQPGDLFDEAPIEEKVNLDTILSRLMMEGKVCIADFVYNIDKRGNQYGWDIAKYTTPELLYGNDIKASCSPNASYEKIFNHLTPPSHQFPSLKSKSY